MRDTETRIGELLDAYFDLPGPERRNFLERMDRISLQGGDWLFRHGDPGDALYLVVRGRLEVWQERDRDGPLANPRLIGGIGPGESVGEIALLSGAPRTAGIRASRDSLLLRITRERFGDWAASHPSLGLKLAGRAASLVAGPPRPPSGALHGVSAVTILPLDDRPGTTAFCDELDKELGRDREVRSVARQRLQALGAPCDWPSGATGPPPNLASWAHRLEGDGSLLVYRCDFGDTAWAGFVLRQSDLVVLVAAADGPPGITDWERELGLDRTDSLLRRALVLLHPEGAGPISGTSDWLAARQPSFHLHVRGGNPDDRARVARVVSGRATGLVLGAGASRGFAHLGVYRALVEAGIPVDWVAGSSIGAIMGSTIAKDWGPQHAINVVRKAFVGGRPFSDYTVPLVSLLSGRRMRRLIGRHAEMDIEDLPLPFLCVSSRLDDGQVIVHRAGRLERALRATASMPGILPPTVVDGRLAVDGSVLDSLPVDLMWREPVGRVIAVSLANTQERRVDYDDTPGPWSILWRRLFPFARPHRVPALATVMLKATELATAQGVDEQGGRASLLLTPDVRRFGLTQVSAFDRIVEAGYLDAREALEGWSARKVS